MAVTNQTKNQIENRYSKPENTNESIQMASVEPDGSIERISVTNLSF